MVFMNKLLVMNIKNVYTHLRPTRNVRLKKGEFYLEYSVAFIEVILLTHKRVF